VAELRDGDGRGLVHERSGDRGAGRAVHGGKPELEDRWGGGFQRGRETGHSMAGLRDVGDECGLVHERSGDRGAGRAVYGGGRELEDRGSGGLQRGREAGHSVAELRERGVDGDEPGLVHERSDDRGAGRAVSGDGPELEDRNPLRGCRGKANIYTVKNGLVY